MIHKNCQTCKSFQDEIKKRQREISNLESNFKLHTKDEKFFKICSCHGYILYSKQGYDKHIKSQKKPITLQSRSNAE